MIRVTVEVVPHGAEPQARTTHVLEIGNVTGFGSYADYRVEGVRDGNVLRPFLIHDHCVADGLDSLVARAFAKLMGIPNGRRPA